MDSVEGITEPIPFLSFTEEDFPGDHGDAEEAEAEEIEGAALFAQFGALDG